MIENKTGDVSDGDVSDGDVSDGDVSDGGVSDGDTCTRNHIAHSLNNSFSWIRDASWIVHRFLHYVSEELVIVITIKRWLHSEGEQRDNMVTDHWRCFVSNATWKIHIWSLNIVRQTFKRFLKIVYVVG